MRYTFTFKDIDTQMKLTLFVESSTTIVDFADNIPDIICNEYGISPNDYVVKIIESGQYNNTNGYKPEVADPIDVMYPLNATFEDIFKDRWKKTSFYMRITKR